MKKKRPNGRGDKGKKGNKPNPRGERLIRALNGKATIKMTTDEIMALTRGE